MRFFYALGVVPLLAFVSSTLAAAEVDKAHAYEQLTLKSAVAAAARIVNATTLRVSFTDRARHTSVTTVHTDFAGEYRFAPQDGVPRGIAFFDIQGEAEPLLLVTVLEEDRETYPAEFFFSARNGRVLPVAEIGFTEGETSRDDRELTRLTRGHFLYEYDQRSTAGGAGAFFNERRRRYAAHRSDTGALVVVETTFTINDYEHEEKQTPPAVGLPACVAMYEKKDTKEPYAAGCR